MANKTSQAASGKRYQKTRGGEGRVEAMCARTNANPESYPDQGVGPLSGKQFPSACRGLALIGQ